MKLKTLVESKSALENLMKCSLPINVAWGLKKLRTVANPELIAYEELRNQKIREMGEPIEGEKDMMRVKPEHLPEFGKIINELLDKDIDVKFTKININDLINYKDANGNGIAILTDDLAKLDWLIDG